MDFWSKLHLLFLSQVSTAQIFIYVPGPKWTSSQILFMEIMVLVTWSQMEFCSNYNYGSSSGAFANGVLLKFSFMEIMVLVPSGIPISFSNMVLVGPKWGFAQIFNYGSGPGA